MPGDDLADVGVPLQHRQIVGRVLKDDLVYRQRRRIGVVVLDDDHGAVPRLVQPRGQPVKPPPAEPPADEARRGSVEEDHPLVACVDDTGHPSMRIVAVGPEDREEGRPVVVIGKRDVYRHRQGGDQGLQQAIGLGFTPVGQVAGEKEEGRVRMVAPDHVQRLGQTGGGVEAVEGQTRQAKMQLRQDDKLQQAYSAIPIAFR